MSKKVDDGFVGNYGLGVENVRLYLVEGENGAACNMRPEDGGSTQMWIYPSFGALAWDACVSGLLHEAMEVCLHRRGCGYRQTHTARESSSDFLFVVSHTTFDQSTEYAARFLVDAMPDVKLALARAINAKKKKGKV